ncbi:large ribosomal subunit protein P1y-like [Pyrus communis]|uniref:large ribosomal subunit protein P1y-like n=1 Tax=Pyrus communis TaxID=23211 RepID=UPI0035C23192
MAMDLEATAITAEKIATLVKAANVPVEPYWPGLFTKLAKKKNIEDLILNSGAGGAVAAPAPGVGDATAPAAAAAAPPPEDKKKKEEPEEESDDDCPISDLFS